MGLLTITVDPVGLDLSAPGAGLILSSLFSHALPLPGACHALPPPHCAELTFESGQFLLEIRPGPFSPG